MPDEITITSSGSLLGDSIADELEAEFAERIKNDAILWNRMSLQFLIEGEVTSVLTISIIAGSVGGTIGNIMGTYAVRLIDSVVEKCKKARAAELADLEIKVVYDATKGAHKKCSFRIPSEAVEAKEFFRQPSDSKQRKQCKILMAAYHLRRQELADDHTVDGKSIDRQVWEELLDNLRKQLDEECKDFVHFKSVKASDGRVIGKQAEWKQNDLEDG